METPKAFFTRVRENKTSITRNPIRDNASLFHKETPSIYRLLVQPNEQVHSQFFVNLLLKSKTALEALLFL